MAHNAPGSFAVRPSFPFSPKNHLSKILVALRRLSSDQRPARRHRLHPRNLDLKLPRLHHRRRTARRHQNAYTKREFRDARIGRDGVPGLD